MDCALLNLRHDEIALEGLHCDQQQGYPERIEWGLPERDQRGGHRAGNGPDEPGSGF
jgi:hypothetical protein